MWQKRALSCAAGVALALLIDTSVLLDYHSGGSALAALATGEPNAISLATVSELLQGVFRAPAARRARNAADVERILETGSARPLSRTASGRNAQSSGLRPIPELRVVAP
jgi:predicted nucleic acid-binding protein